MKYEPLQKHLSGLPEATTELNIQFREIEAIIGASLPPSASTHRPWWGNERDPSRSQAASWLGAGFVVDGVDLQRKLVRFCRVGRR